MYKSKLFNAVYACCFSILLSATANAEIVGSHSLRAEMICDKAISVTSLDLDVFFGEAVPDAGGPAYLPFDTLTITSASIGDEFFVTDAAQFASAVSLLTNNTVELVGEIVWSNCLIISSGYPESTTLTGSAFNGTDFYGSTIVDMRLTISDYGQYDISASEQSTYIDYRVEYFDAPIPLPPVIDNTATVAPDAEIGDGSTVGANTIINKDVTVGEGSVIGANVIINKEAQLGDNTEIGDGSTIHKDVTAGDDLTVGNNVIIHKDVMIGERVTIGDNTVIHSGTMIGNDVLIGVGVFIGNDVIISNNETIGDYTVISNNTTVP